MQAGAKDAFKAAGGMTLQNWVLQENNLLGDPAAVFITCQTGITEGAGSQAVGLGTPSPNPSAGIFQVPWSLDAPGGFTLTCSTSREGRSGMMTAPPPEPVEQLR